jgi:hypothetical protein
MKVICPECGLENPPGTLYCARCNAALPYDEQTPVIGAAELVRRVNEHQRLSGNAGLYGAPATVILNIADCAPLRVWLGKKATLGRQGPPEKPAPDVDLGDYEALKRGVSRVHAVIQNHGSILTLTDLGSTNGTLLNGEKLSPNKPRIIKSNDEIRLGRLVMRIQFGE